MDAVTAMPTSDTWTVDDLDRLPDDGLRYELADGVLLVAPAPRPLHQRGAFRLARLLDGACPPELEVYLAPVDFRPTRRRSLQPDVLVVRREDLREDGVQAPPLLVVEVLSPGTRLRDLTLKRALYAQSGVPSYWLLDPAVPSLTVLTLESVQGEPAYQQTASVSGQEQHRAEQPFPVAVVPATLVR